MFHVISNIDLDHFEFADDQHEVPNGTKYILIPGSISEYHKRSNLFLDTLAKRYPSCNIIMNVGYDEMIGRNPYKIIDAFLNKVSVNKDQTPNLYFPKGETIGDFSFYSAVGWPSFTPENYEAFIKDSKLVESLTGELYIDDILVCNSWPVYLTYDNYNEFVEEEKNNINKWLNDSRCEKKILLLAISSISETFDIPCTYLDQIITQDNLFIVSTSKTITSSTDQLISCPGRSRNNLFEF